MGKITFEETKLAIKELCELALNGNIGIDEFYCRWPKEADGNLFYSQAHDDVEDAIEHAPGYWLKSGVNMDAWKKTVMYKILNIDAVLLDYDKSASDLLACRKYVLENISKNDSNWRCHIQKFFDQKHTGRVR